MSEEKAKAGKKAVQEKPKAAKAAEEQAKKAEAVEKPAAEAKTEEASGKNAEKPKPAEKEQATAKKAGEKPEAAEKKQEEKTQKDGEKTAEKKQQKETVEKKQEEAGKKKKKKEKVKLEKVRKSPEVKRLREMIKQKRKRPVFRGRFGKRKIRKKSVEKWNKWRKPRGIDIKRKKEDGAWPRPGYGALREIKGIHPSGFAEVMVSNPSQLSGIGKNIAVRISAGVGRKKRLEIARQANKQGIHVLNY